MSPHCAAAIQMVSGADVGANLRAAAALIAEARAAGADVIALPENFACMGASETDKLAYAEPDGKGPLQDFLGGQATRHGVWLLGGTIPLRDARPGRVRAASLLYGPQGERLARYDKMHLFDVTLTNGEDYRESATIAPGTAPVAVDVAGLRLGLSVCYDLRFPELYRALGAADILFVPAAFTQRTGAAHWEVLLRARAIENLAYVVAPNQGGEHPGGRRTYGHSMIIDPWGQDCAICNVGPGMALMALDLERLRKLRGTFPCLEHRILV